MINLGSIGSWPYFALAAFDGVASAHARGWGIVGKTAAASVFVAAMVGVIVAMDILVFRQHFWERLAANIGTVLVFLAFYFRFLHRR